MSNEVIPLLDKSIEHGKEHRKPYRYAKQIDKQCRNHGACPYCKENRMFFDTKRRIVADEKLKKYVGFKRWSGRAVFLISLVAQDIISTMSTIENTFVCQRTPSFVNSRERSWFPMSNGGYQRPIVKLPSEFTRAVVQLIKWRDSVKDRRKAMAIQRVIDRKIQWVYERKWGK